MRKSKKQVNARFDYSRWFSAQKSIFGDEGLSRLADVRLLIVGSGGIGFNMAVGAARCGIQTIFHCDAQRVEEDNLNRILARASHIGEPKVRVVEKLLRRFDRAESDHSFSYFPIQQPVENPSVIRFLDQATHIISCPNSISGRQYAVKCAVDRQIPLFNVGISCEPGKSMKGEVSVYWPGDPRLACPCCISLKKTATSTNTPLSYPPLIVLVGLTLQLLWESVAVVNATYPNYLLYDALEPSILRLAIESDAACLYCQ